MPLQRTWTIELVVVYALNAFFFSPMLHCQFFPLSEHIWRRNAAVSMLDFPLALPIYLYDIVDHHHLEVQLNLRELPKNYKQWTTSVHVNSTTYVALTNGKLEKELYTSSSYCISVIKPSSLSFSTLYTPSLMNFSISSLFFPV